METITLIADRDAKSPAAEAYRTIRTNIQFSNVGQELKTIIVTSATPNEGKSTTISNLAVVMAQAGHKVLLMDCDMRNPTQHKLFKLTNRGLSNCISASEDVRTLIQKTGIDNLELLASGPVAPNPSELLGSKRMEQLLEQLKPDYAQVLYLKHFEDFDTAEIASIMKKSKKQVGDLLYRAKNALKAELEKEGIVYEKL